MSGKRGASEHGGDAVSTGGFWNPQKSVRAFHRGLLRCPGVDGSGLTWISDTARRSYATELLIRLMFLQFLQRAGWLAGDCDYLRRRLEASAARGRDRFYREVFLPLCFFSVGCPVSARGRFTRKFEDLVYLGGGLFQPHSAEVACGVTPEAVAAGQLPPGAIVPDDYFRRWLDHFDRWDWVLDERRAYECAVTPAVLGYTFENAVHRKSTGTFYTSPDVAGYMSAATILPHLLDGLDGVSEGAVPRPPGPIRRYFHRFVGREAQLPGETEREYRGRQERLAALEQEFDGRPPTTEECLTHNLDLRRVALDRIRALTNPDVLQRFYDDVLSRTRIVDPTCGTGDFLLAAVDVLSSIYAACELRFTELGGSTAPRAPALENNLYGVDLMEDAVRTCRLRLYLKALSPLPRSAGITGGPVLPDLERTVRAGNAVVGFTRDSGNGSPDERLLDRYRAVGLVPEGAELEWFRDTHHPLHWSCAFPEVMAAGGFDGVIGNPPYVDSSEVRRWYRALDLRTETCENVYAWIVERGLELLKPEGRLGMIVPVSAVSVGGYRPLMELLRSRDCWISSYSNRPAKLFEGVEQRLTILLTGRRVDTAPGRIMTSPYQHWYEEERPHLFERLTYHEASIWCGTGMPIKSGCALAERVFRKIVAHSGRLEELCSEGEAVMWLHDGPTYWVRALSFHPGEDDYAPAHYHRVGVSGQNEARVLAAILSSSTYYFFYKMVSNCRDLGRRDWAEFPIDPLAADLRQALTDLGVELERRLRTTSKVRSRVYPSGAVTYREYYPAQAKDVIDRIDAVLARHYHFTSDELDYVRNYDLKYRMGRGGAAEREPE